MNIRDWRERCIFDRFIREFPQVLVFKMVGYDKVELVFHKRYGIKATSRIVIFFKDRCASLNGADFFEMETIREYIPLAIDKLHKGEYQEYEVSDNNKVIRIVIGDD